MVYCAPGEFCPDLLDPLKAMEARPPQSKSMIVWAFAAVAAVLFFGVLSIWTFSNAGRGPVEPYAPAVQSGTPLPATPSSMTPSVVSAASGDATPQPIAAPVEHSDPISVAALWISAVSAITALLGLAMSTWLGWRKERREVVQAKAELERTQLEIEKLRRDLARSQNTADH
jgi:hypothetical protein